MNKLITCLKELERLKTVERGLNVGSRKESSAEHSWSCMLIADIILDYINEPLNRLRIFEILLYHDVVEVYAGDAKFNKPEQMRVKKEKEEVATKKIISLLPDSTRYESLMFEYETRHSRESLFAKAIDCIDACITNLNDDKKTNAGGFSEELIRNKYKPHIQKFDFINKLFEVLMNKLKQQDKL